MKYIVTIICCLFLQISINAQDDAIEKLFPHLSSDESVSSIYVSPKMFEMMLKIDVEEMNDDLKEVLKSIKGLRIVSTDENGMDMFKESKTKLKSDRFELLMNLKEDDQDIEFMIKENGDTVEELMMLIGSENGFTMMSFLGNIDIKKLSRLAKDMNISGLEHLEKLENN